MICCDTDNFLGCLCTCEDIDTGVEATQTGDYTIEAIYSGSTWSKTIPIVTGANIIIPSTPDEQFFREYGVTKFRIKDPSGNYITDINNGIICYKFKAIIKAK